MSWIDYFDKYERPQKHEKSLQFVSFLVCAAPCHAQFLFRLKRLAS